MGDFPIITTDELQKKLDSGENLELVDVREDEEVAEGMIPGAKHIKMMDIPARLNEFDRDTEYIIICRSSNRSAHVCHFMHEQGFKVKNMLGGMLDWRGKVE